MSGRPSGWEDIGEHARLFRVVDAHTGAEPDLEEIALHENWARHLMYCDLDGFSIEEDGTLPLLDECGA